MEKKKEINRSSFLEDLNMNDNRITNLKHPSHGIDAAITITIRLCNQMKTDIKRIEKGYDATIKEIEKKVKKSKTTGENLNKIKASMKQKIDALVERSLAIAEENKEKMDSLRMFVQWKHA